MKSLRATPRLVVSTLVFALLTSTNLSSLLSLDKPTFAQTHTPRVDTIVESLDQPIAFDWLPDGTMLITEKEGALKQVRNNEVSTIATFNVSSISERGLLGVAVDPQYLENNYVYFYYSTANGYNRVSRATFDENGLSNQFILLDNIFSSDQGNHNAGDLQFDAERNLYVSTGDGGGGNACRDCSQSIDSLSGKILKINPDTGEGAKGNPFADSSNENARRVWAMGLRNPYRIAVDPQTNNVIIADVGESQFEELNTGAAGANYGWPNVEGPFPAGQSGMTYPAFYYARSGNNNDSFNNCRSITGGVFVEGNNFPTDYQNDYIFGDFTCGKIWHADADNLNSPSLLVQNAGSPVHFGFGPDGALYYSDISTGSIKRVAFDDQHSPTQTPTSTATPSTTLQPTVPPRPTINPITPTPISTPTTVPTPTVTVNPSAIPTLTAAPTVTPTMQPTTFPSTRPEQSPTPMPSVTPIATPTASPSGDNQSSRTKITVVAMGQAGGGAYPDVQLVVKGKPIAQATTTQNMRRYSITLSEHITIADISINYPNDYWNPETGDDRNLRIDKVIVNDTVYETEDPGTYSVGSWDSTNGCAAGYKTSEWIHCPGYFKLSVPASESMEEDALLPL